MRRKVPMKMCVSMLCAVCLVVLAALLPLRAHHSVSTMFDRNRPVTITGVVTKVEWLNPHIWIYVDETDDQDGVTHWELEGAQPNGLSRRGWRRDSLKPGDEVAIEGEMSRCCDNVAKLGSVKLADGTTIWQGSAQDPN